MCENPPAAYKALYSRPMPPPTPPRGDATRRELVRVEIDSDGNEMADSLELVAEYAIDLKFGLTVVSGFATPATATSPGIDPAVIQFPIGDARNYEYTYEPSSSSPVNDKAPHRIRSVRARLAVRSREADRAASVSAPTTAPPGTLFRYSIGADAGFARVRTLSPTSAPSLASIVW
jgi:hypothetical protein